MSFVLKFIYSEKATKFCEIFTLILYYVVPVKSKVKISQRIYELYLQIRVIWIWIEYVHEFAEHY